MSCLSVAPKFYLPTVALLEAVVLPKRSAFMFCCSCVCAGLLCPPCLSRRSRVTAFYDRHLLVAVVFAFYGLYLSMLRTVHLDAFLVPARTVSVPVQFRLSFTLAAAYWLTTWPFLIRVVLTGHVSQVAFMYMFV